MQIYTKSYVANKMSASKITKYLSSRKLATDITTKSNKIKLFSETHIPTFRVWNLQIKLQTLITFLHIEFKKKCFRSV